jgi:hypothetical protein
MKIEELGPNLLAAFATVPDARSRHGRRHPLPAILALTTAAMLSGARSLYAVAQWGRGQSPEVVRALGFTRARTPAVATLHYTFKTLDVAAFEAVLQQWAQAARAAVGMGAPLPWEAVALDGKALRGLHGQHGEELPGVRLVSAYAVSTGLVLAQKGGQDQFDGRQRDRGGEGAQ